jgi:mannose-6-phosphate isomerase-like protein (cupin superfamily)
MPFVETRELPMREPKPGWHGRFFHSQSMTFAYYAIDGGASLHEHSHANEEVWNVLSGELEITIGGDTFRAGAGAAAVVPPHTAHSVRALAPSAVIVVDEGFRGEIGGGQRAALAVELRASDAGGLELEIRNLGRDPGVLRRVDLELGHSAALPPPTRTEIPRGDLPERTAIAGGATLRREHASGDGPVAWVRGAIFYEDARGERHHTTFCRVVDRANGLIPPAKPGYNYGD